MSKTGKQAQIPSYEDGVHTKILRWNIEDPSEFRPGLENMGKDYSGFRTFYDVSQGRD